MKSASPGSPRREVAQTAGQLIGWTHVHPHVLLESEPGAEIGALVVDASARRHGAGRALVAQAVHWARQHRFKRLLVRSNVARDEAHRFYPSIGFKRIKTQHNYELSLDGRGP